MSLIIASRFWPETDGRIYAVQVWRAVIYLPWRCRYRSLMNGGHMVTWRGKRLVARLTRIPYLLWAEVPRV